MTRIELVNLAIEKLGALFNVEDDDIIVGIGDTVIDEALNTSNRLDTAESLDILRGVIVDTIVIAYQNRGSEGLKSQNELGQSNSFVDWNDYLTTNIIKKGKRVVF